MYIIFPCFFIGCFTFISNVSAAFGQNVDSSSSQPEFIFTIPDSFKLNRFEFSAFEEDTPHSSDFEWWYHFGYLTDTPGTDFKWALFSSFQKTILGRYLLFRLTDLRTGNSFYTASVDRSLLAGGSLLPHHKLIEKSDTGCRKLKYPLNLCYGINSFHKEDTVYSLKLQDESFYLKLTALPAAPPMYICGTGKMGLKRKKEVSYYSFTKLNATGQLSFTTGENMKVHGVIWYDHQWGELTLRLLAWRWWGIRLETGESINLYFIRDKLSSRIVEKVMTIEYPNGDHFVLNNIDFNPDSTWQSPRSGRKYVVGWKITVGELPIEIEIKSIYEDHEIPVLGTLYLWEGPCRITVRNIKTGREVNGYGFQELLGSGVD
ncbi:MAG: hypothetical protein HYY40_00300 [Bacteroidetes bacterium]|nr:hypothetical protein [Bacteroidota bacterium]